MRKLKTYLSLWTLLSVLLAFGLVPLGQAQNLTYNSTDLNGNNRVFNTVSVNTTSSLTVFMKTNHPGGGIIISLRFGTGTPTGQFTANTINADGSTGSAVTCYGLHNGIINATTVSGSLANVAFANFEQWSCPYVPGGTLAVALNAFTSPGSLSFDWISTASPFTISPLANPWNFTHISTATNTLVKGNPGFVHTITINGGTAGIVTVVDTSVAACTGGTTLAVIETISATNPTTLTYDAQLSNGLCITTAAATDVTATWK